MSSNTRSVRNRPLAQARWAACALLALPMGFSCCLAGEPEAEKPKPEEAAEDLIREHEVKLDEKFAASCERMRKLREKRALLSPEERRKFIQAIQDPAKGFLERKKALDQFVKKELQREWLLEQVKKLQPLCTSYTKLKYEDPYNFRSKMGKLAEVKKIDENTTRYTFLPPEKEERIPIYIETVFELAYVRKLGMLISAENFAALFDIARDEAMPYEIRVEAAEQLYLIGASYFTEETYMRNSYFVSGYENNITNLATFISLWNSKLKDVKITDETTERFGLEEYKEKSLVKIVASLRSHIPKLKAALVSEVKAMKEKEAREEQKEKERKEKEEEQDKATDTR